jgi:predicted PurR-regulated permease PerM
VIISGSDNLIKAYVIGNRARMHPYVVLVTVLGAIQFVGLWGVFLGPITAAFFYSLVNILHQKFAPPISPVANQSAGANATEGPVDPPNNAAPSDLPGATR